MSELSDEEFERRVVETSGRAKARGFRRVERRRVMRPGEHAQITVRCDGYSLNVEWSDEDRVYVARVDKSPSLAARGTTPAAALDEIRKLL